MITYTNVVVTHPNFPVAYKLVENPSIVVLFFSLNKGIRLSSNSNPTGILESWCSIHEIDSDTNAPVWVPINIEISH